MTHISETEFETINSPLRKDLIVYMLRYEAFPYVVLNMCLLPQCFLFAFCQ